MSFPATAQTQGCHREALIDLRELVLARPRAILIAFCDFFDFSLFPAAQLKLETCCLSVSEGVHWLVRGGTEVFACELGHQERASFFLLLHVVGLVVEAVRFGVDNVVFFRVVRRRRRSHELCLFEERTSRRLLDLEARLAHLLARCLVVGRVSEGRRELMYPLEVLNSVS